MRLIRVGILIGVFVGFALWATSAQAQDTLPAEISSAYSATLATLQTAKTPEDIRAMVEAMDSKDWVSISPNGEKNYRDDAEKQLVGLLSIPVGKRPVPKQKIIYVNIAGSITTTVFWVYRTTDQGAVGSLIRDTWEKTELGWRRSLHEKLFPDRLLDVPQ